MNAIVRPVTTDRMCGYDAHNQFVISWKDGEYTTSTFGTDVRCETCAICLHGWAATSESMRDQTMWRLIGTVVHQSCLVRHESLIERADFERAMVKAKLRYDGFRLRPNGYWPESLPWSKAPWYEAELCDYAATVVLGRRKNVTHIELRIWDGSVANVEMARTAFADEDVTKEVHGNYVLMHAWTYEKVFSYLTKIRELLEGGLITLRAP